MEGTYEHPSSSLGHSEELSVENPVGPPVPELAQATEERPKILASITGEESRYVLEEDGGRSVALHKVKEGEGEAAALPGEAGPLACDGEVLAREAAGPEGGGMSTAGDQPIPTPLPTLSGGLVLVEGGAGSCAPAVGSKISGKSNDVSEVRDSRPSLCEDGAGVRVDLGEADGAPSGSLEAEVESSNS